MGSTPRPAFAPGGSGRWWRAVVAAVVAAWACGIAGGAGVRAGAAAPEEGQAAGLELSAQAVSTLLARRHEWIWRVAPNQLQVRESRAGDGRLRLVWVSAPADPRGGPARHAFALLAQVAPERDIFADLTAFIDTGYPTFAVAPVELAPGTPGFLIGAGAAPSKPQPALYVVVAPRPPSYRAESAVALRVQGDLIMVDRDARGALRIQAGSYDFGQEGAAVLEVPPEGAPSREARPARAVTLATHTWNPAAGGFEVVQREPLLTPFGVAETFLDAVRRADMARALSLTSLEWRRVMGVDTAERLRAYLEGSRPGLLNPANRYRLVGASVGQEAASILFSDLEGRIYRIRLRLGTRDAREVLVLPGPAAERLRGPWEVDGLDGGG